MSTKVKVVIAFLILVEAFVSAKRGDPILGNVIEEFVKNLFNREMSTASNQNLTDCVTRLLCENICTRTMQGEVKGEVLISTARLMGRTESDPLGYFFTGGDRGFQYGKEKNCDRCAQKYHNCLPLQYELTKTSSGAFEKTMLEPTQTLEPRKRRSSMFDL